MRLFSKAARSSNQKKDALDDDLAALENEGLDDIDDEEEKKEKPKEQKKPEEKKEQPKPQPKPQPKKEEVPKGPDLYLEQTEKMYHKVEKMNSLSTLENEKAVCDKIIEYKKKINADYDDWEIKKDNINLRIENIQTSIEGGLWDLDRYKKEILNQYKYEIKLLQFIDKDKNLKDEQKKALKERIEERKKLIDKELKESDQMAEEEKEE